ncbi:hypothetical protein CQR37_03730 [Enterococcus faecium]|uniref:Uncharacterized protein n=1 Tax=Enterococcus faecium TaxID=1352 RepID=A0A2G0EDA0_ENTFC|nr:hypothetical protein CQR37_03730 [Enterococcus faecium]
MPIIPFFIQKKNIKLQVFNLFDVLINTQKKNIKLQVFNLFDVLINTLYNEGYDQTLERS